MKMLCICRIRMKLFWMEMKINWEMKWNKTNYKIKKENDVELKYWKVIILKYDKYSYLFVDLIKFNKFFLWWYLFNF